MVTKEINIIVIDDDEIDRDTYKRHLQREDSFKAVIREAWNAKEGIELIKQKQPDCVLVDYSLPGKNGIELIKKHLKRIFRNCLPYDHVNRPR